MEINGIAVEDALDVIMDSVIKIRPKANHSIIEAWSSNMPKNGFK